ncbi:CCT domain [Sesbania bispinosa]|nr:CCT domain [Sesbania bispinosa]
MGYTSLLRSPKKEEQEVPDTITPILPNSSNEAYADEDFNILDELEGVLNSTTEEEQKLLPQNTCSGQFQWDFMEWEKFSPVGEEAEEHQATENRSKCMLEEQQIIKRENNDVGFWEVDDEKMMALNLNLNYQEVLDAWSDRGSLWADDCSLSLASNNNGYYMGEVPILEEERTRREASVLRYKEKRQNRLFSKKIRYQVRKLNADKRPRIKGRFVKRH